MKFSFGLFLLIFLLMLLAQSNTKGQCLESKALERFQVGVINAFNLKIDSVKTLRERDYLNVCKSNFERNVKLDSYRTMSTFFNQVDIACDSIISWSIIEIYLWHDYTNKAYMIIETKSNEFFAVSYDISWQKGTYLGKMSEDFLSEMARSIFHDIGDDPAQNYFLYGNFTKEFNHTPEVKTDLHAWTIVPMLILERSLLKK